jgi:hypothetical protein
MMKIALNLLSSKKSKTSMASDKQNPKDGESPDT